MKALQAEQSTASQAAKEKSEQDVSEQPSRLQSTLKINKFEVDEPKGISDSKNVAMFLLGTCAIIIIVFSTLMCSKTSYAGNAAAADSTYVDTTAVTDDTPSAQYEEHKKEVMNSIKIERAYLSSPNSAGGVDAIISFENVSGKTIKYVLWEGKAKNAVGDFVLNEIGYDEDFGGRYTGPMGTGKSETARWDCVIYNNTAERLVLTKIKVQYMDGTEVVISKDEIPLIR